MKTTICIVVEDTLPSGTTIRTQFQIPLLDAKEQLRTHFPDWFHAVECCERRTQAARKLAMAWREERVDGSTLTKPLFQFVRGAEGQNKEVFRCDCGHLSFYRIDPWSALAHKGTHICHGCGMPHTMS